MLVPTAIYGALLSKLGMLSMFVRLHCYVHVAIATVPRAVGVVPPIVHLVSVRNRRHRTAVSKIDTSRWQRTALCSSSFFSSRWHRTALSHASPSSWATNPRSGGRPTQELAGDQPQNWRATSPRTGGRPTQELAGDQPKNWRATNPRTGGRLTQELAGDQPKNWWATNPRTGGRPPKELVGD